MGVGPDYCSRAQVLSALYAGMGMAPGDPAPSDATRDAELDRLISAVSRDFDHEVVGYERPGLFAPKFETRLFSGTGETELDLDPFLAIDTGNTAQVQYNSTPGRTPTWVDITTELTTYLMGAIPLEGFPKHKLFRQVSWYPDPYPLGNIQITALWGVCQPDPTSSPPAGGIPGLAGPIPSAYLPPTGGWWVTPDDVQMAVTEWVVHQFEHGKAGYADSGVTPGPASLPGGSTQRFAGDIPSAVQRIINRYKDEDGDHPKLALVSNEYDSGPAEYRWRDWVTR